MAKRRKLLAERKRREVCLGGECQCQFSHLLGFAQLLMSSCSPLEGSKRAPKPWRPVLKISSLCSAVARQDGPLWILWRLVTSTASKRSSSLQSRNPHGLWTHVAAQHSVGQNPLPADTGCCFHRPDFCMTFAERILLRSNMSAEVWMPAFTRLCHEGTPRARAGFERFPSLVTRLLQALRATSYFPPRSHHGQKRTQSHVKFFPCEASADVSARQVTGYWLRWSFFTSVCQVHS